MLSRLLRYDSEPTPTERADDTRRRRGGETGRACPCPYFGKHGASASLPSPQSAVKLESRLGAVRSPLSSRCALAPAGYSGFSFDSIRGIIWVRRGRSKTKNRYYENERTNRRLSSAGAGGRHSLNTIATAPAAGLCGRCAALRTPRRHRPPETRAGGAGPAAARHLRTPAARPRTTAARPPRTTAARRPVAPAHHRAATHTHARRAGAGAQGDAPHGTAHTFRLPGTAYATALPASTYATTGYTYSASYRLGVGLPQACPCSRRLRRNSSAGGTALETALDLRGGGGGSSP